MTPPSGFSPSRRRILGALGAAALGAGCVTPIAPPRPLDPSRAPRAGDRWIYAYRSDWANVPPRTLEVEVLSVSDKGIADRMNVQGDPAAFAERLFGSQLEIVALPLGGALIHEFSPYLEAFGPLPAGSFGVALPPSNWGTAWSGSARVAGAEQVIVPAGSFQATRVEILGARIFLAGQMDDAADPVRLFATAWFAPSVKRCVRFSFVTQAQRLNPLARDHLELASFRVG
jgi:hypothetical protein